ncbi:hypothetical protein [Catalinimonas niigatensis]|uniref:hypothetical protein n=1 Tax=Catalinimonas niigatensis TaxID=1397264 RepID=UPI0026665829|nr:hypothetical protein [Catalinimonas niigatensis]WPP50870.1 hypothetical protein PZB72_00490 [Catalinimonas niigatensis]
MNSIEINGLQYFFYLSWNAHFDTSSISFIPKGDSLERIIQQNMAADKILYDLFIFLDEYFFELRNQFDFCPLFQETVELFEIQIFKKAISTNELSGVIHAYLRDANIST